MFLKGKNNSKKVVAKKKTKSKTKKAKKKAPVAVAEPESIYLILILLLTFNLKFNNFKQKCAVTNRRGKGEGGGVVVTPWPILGPAPWPVFY